MAIQKEIEIKVTEQGTENVKSKIGGLNKSLDESTKSNKQLSNSQDQVTQSTQKQKASFEDLGGGIGGAVVQVKALGKQFLALLANPIVLFLTAITGALILVYKAFASTNDGADKIEQTMKGVSAVIDILRDRLLVLAGAIVKALKGDFVGAMKDAKSSVNGFGAEVEKEFKQAANATRQLQEVEDAMRSLSITRAKLDRDLAKSKELLTDENASYEQKKKALNDIKIAEGRQTEQELKNAKKKLDAIKELNSLSDTSDEDLKKQADAEVALINLQQKSAEDRRNINKQEKRADSDERARVKQINDERISRQKEYQAKRLDSIKKSQEEEKTLIDEKLSNDKLSFEQQRKLVESNNKLSIKDKKDFLKKINNEELKSIEEHKQAILNLENKYKIDIENLNAKTEQQKLDLQKARDLQELEQIAKTEDEKIKLKLSFDEKYNILQNELNEKIDAEKFEKTLAKATELADNEELSFQDRLMLLQEREFLIQDMFKGSEEEKLKLIEENQSKIDSVKDASAKEDANREEALSNFKQNLASTTLNLLGGLAKQGSKLGKAVAVSQATISTFQGVNKALAETTDFTPTQSLRFLNAAIVGASGLANIGKIISTPEVSVGSGASSGGGQSVPQAPSFNLVEGSGTNQIAESLSRDKSPIKAYVISSDVTTSQALDRSIETTATI